MTYYEMLKLICYNPTLKARRPHWPESIWLVGKNYVGWRGRPMVEYKIEGDPELIKEWMYRPTFNYQSIKMREIHEDINDWQIFE